MRIHYAGFVHPWFGYDSTTDRRTPLIFEIRGQGAARVSLGDGEKIGRLRFFDMSRNAPDPEEYSQFTGQRLKASPFTRPLHEDEKLEWVNESEGIVKPRGN